MEGSYNICLMVKLNAKPTCVIRFPQPGTTATPFLDEKVRNEVQVMESLRQTTIPLPKVYSWGLTSDSPSKIGPFIIMEYVEGKRLIDEIQQPIKTDDGVEMDLWEDLGNPRVLHAYSQIADYLLQIYQLDFDAAGSISRSGSDKWVASERPLTGNMNILARNIPNYPTQYFPATTISSPRMYFQQLADQHLAHYTPNATPSRTSKMLDDVLSRVTASNSLSTSTYLPLPTQVHSSYTARTSAHRT